jgi:shikimate kinase
MLAETLAGSGAVIACGGGIVLDTGNRAALRAQSFVIHLVASVDEQLARLARDRSRPLLQTDDRRARLETLADHRDPLYAEVADLRFYPGDTSAACAARELAVQLDAASDTSWTKRND